MSRLEDLKRRVSPCFIEWYSYEGGTECCSEGRVDRPSNVARQSAMIVSGGIVELRGKNLTFGSCGGG
jgi:hypothetical protein